jgi:hypothetical protein
MVIYKKNSIAIKMIAIYSLLEWTLRSNSKLYLTAAILDPLCFWSQSLSRHHHEVLVYDHSVVEV